MGLQGQSPGAAGGGWGAWSLASDAGFLVRKYGGGGVWGTGTLECALAALYVCGAVCVHECEARPCDRACACARPRGGVSQDKQAGPLGFVGIRLPAAPELGPRGHFFLKKEPPPGGWGRPAMWFCAESLQLVRLPTGAGGPSPMGRHQLAKSWDSPGSLPTFPPRAGRPAAPWPREALTPGTGAVGQPGPAPGRVGGVIVGRSLSPPDPSSLFPRPVGRRELTPGSRPCP